MKSKMLHSTLVSAALLAACSQAPDTREVKGLGSACIEGMQILIIHPDKGQSHVPYRVLKLGTDQEIDDWILSGTQIAYLTWANKFIMKEVNYGKIEVIENSIFEFSINECM